MQIGSDPKIEYLPGKAWLNIPFFENHLLDELHIPHSEEPNGITRLAKDTAAYGDIIYKENFPAVYGAALYCAVFGDKRGG